MDRDRQSTASPGSILFVLVLAQTIISLDFSLVSIALPSLQRDLGLSAATAQWILTVDIIVYGGFMIVGGRFADKYGERLSLTVGLGLFLVGSLINVVGGTFEALIFGRAVQGLGAAATFPATMGLIARSFAAGAPRFRALTISTAVQACGIPVGTMLAGLLVTSYGGHAAFFLNVVICIMLLPLIRWKLPRGPASPRNGSIPIVSAIILAAGIGLMIQGALGVFSKDDDARALAMYSVPASIAILAIFIQIQRRSTNPLFDLALIKIENLGVYILATAMMVLVGKGMIVLSNMSLQTGLGFSAWEASLTLIPFAFSSVALVFIMPFMADQMQNRPRATMAASFLIMGALFASLANMPGAYAGVAIILILFIQPLLSVPGVNTGVGQIMGRAPHADQGVVAGMLYTMVQIVGGMGMAFMIAAKDQSPDIAHEFARFAPGFLIGVLSCVIGAILLALAIRPFMLQPRKRPQILSD